MNEKWIVVGKIKEAHGLKGELTVIFFAKEYEWLKQQKKLSLQLQKDSELRQMILSHFRPKGDHIIARFEGIENRTQAEALEGHMVSIPVELLVSQKDERIFLREILNFTVMDRDTQVGRVQGFSSNGPQDLLIVATDEGQCEIPFVEALLKDIDFSQQIIHMEIPEGLLDINRPEKKSK